jgi:O-antigen/teichoic acid export membrane protein
MAENRWCAGRLSMWVGRIKSRVTQGSFRRHLSAIMVSEIIARVAQFGVLALAARHLTPSAFGVYGLAVAIHQMALAIVQNGPELHATRLMAQQHGGKALVWRVMGVKFFLAVAAYATALLIGWSVYGSIAVLEQIMVQGLLLPIVAVGSTWVLKATGRFSIFALFRSGQALLFVAWVALFVTQTNSPLAVPLAEAAATAMVVLSSVPYCLRLAGARADTHVDRMLGPSLALGFSGLCSEAVWSAPVTIGGLFLAAPALGRVAGVNRIISALNGVFQMLIQVFYPALAHRYARDPQSGRALAGTLLVYAGLGAAAVIAIGTVFAGPFIHLLLGPGMKSAVPVLRLWLWALAPAFTGTVAGYVLLANGKHRHYTAVAVVSLVAAALCAGIGYAILPVAEMAAVQAIALAVSAAIQLVVAMRWGLIDGSGFSWTLLRPAGLRQLLSQS